MRRNLEHGILIAGTASSKQSQGFCAIAVVTNVVANEIYCAGHSNHPRSDQHGKQDKLMGEIAVGRQACQPLDIDGCDGVRAAI
jgi:hypothetical protein